MSQSKVAARESIRNQNQESPFGTGPAETGRVLEALDDEDCRTMLAATSEQALPVSDICAVTEIAESTAYRKVETLVETGLLEEHLRIRSSGNHVSTYVCTFEDVTLTVDGDDGIELTVTQADSEGGISTPTGQI